MIIEINNLLYLNENRQGGRHDWHRPATPSKLYLPERGIRINLPKNLATNIIKNDNSDLFYNYEYEYNGKASAIGWEFWDEENFHVGETDCPKTITISPAKEWLTAMAENSVLRRRYPTSDCGERYMRIVSPEWGKFLTDQSQIFATEANKELSIQGFGEISILLFGSVSRGLAKYPNHPKDRSNLDILIVGNFDDKLERDKVLNIIHPIREDVNSSITREEDNPEYHLPNIHEIQLCEESFKDDVPQSLNLKEICRVGVIASSVEKLKRDEYNAVRNYLSSGAYPLTDDQKIWTTLQYEAIPYLWMHNLTDKRYRGYAKRRIMPQLVKYFT